MGSERADRLKSELSGALAATGWLSGAIFPATWPSTPIGGDEEEGRWEPAIRYRVVDRFDLDEFDSKRRRDNPHDWLKRELTKIALPFTVAIPGWSERLKRAFSLFDLGETSRFEALKVFYYAAALETLMLLPPDVEGKQKPDSNIGVTARLKDSVAWFLGTPADRTDLKKQVDEIYDKRSKFVHNGDFNGEPFMSDKAREVVMRVIRKELGSPPPAPAA